MKQRKTKRKRWVSLRPVGREHATHVMFTTCRHGEQVECEGGYAVVGGLKLSGLTVRQVWRAAHECEAAGARAVLTLPPFAARLGY